MRVRNAVFLIWWGFAGSAWGAVPGAEATPGPWAGGPGGEQVAPGSERPSGEKPALAMPVREVTVYSDRARVERAGELALSSGVRRILVALLPPSLDPRSVRLEVSGASLQRVEVRRADLGELPRGEAEALLLEIERARDLETALADARDAAEAERRLLLGLRPSTSPRPDPAGPPVLLEPAGWTAALSFVDARSRAAEEAIRGLERKQRDAAQATAQRVARAAQLAAEAGGRPGFKVEAVVEGRGAPARLTLTYLAGNARWYPAYDLRFSPEAAQVEVDFAGLVSQQTGEDWEQARLILSTAVPATVAAMPRLAAWKIGDRDRFIPTPKARPDPVPAQSPPPPRAQVGREAGDLDDLRSALAQAADAPGPETYEAYDDRPAAGEARKGDKRSSAVPSRPPRVAPMPSSPPPPSSRSRPRYETDEAVSMVSERSAPTLSGLLSFGQGGAAPSQEVGFGAPRGWRAPDFAADLPASLAGGYDFVFPSARPESVRSGGEARRVALHRATLPARTLVTILPALRRQVFLVAEVINQSDRPLLRGQANLYVGADMQGQALIETTAVGEKVGLPLGIDEAIRVERQVQVVESEKGLLSKEDVSRYEVVVELLNPRKAPVDARVVDQIPLQGEQTVSIKLEKSEPLATLNKDEGTLEWRLQLPPGAKKTLTFTYTVTRPRGAKLRQW